MGRKAKRKNTSGYLRKSQFNEFLSKIADVADASNVDHYFRSGAIEDKQSLVELGSYFLKIAMGFRDDEFIPCITNPDFPNFVPQSEDYYPWALFVSETTTQDLDEVFHRRAINYLHSDSAGKKNYAVITNMKQLSVYDLKHEVVEYSFSFVDLHDSLNHSSREKRASNATKSWEKFLEEFGPDSSKEKKKQRREDVVSYVQPKEDRLGFVKRFGHMPSFQKPIGWDGKNFQETFKTKSLPFLTTERIDWEGATKNFKNKLIWGDNLSVMRSLPSETVDMVYIDPPFFSGRNYNCIFGDDDEVRTFTDIWDGGLPTYLAWLNARLWEMKRILKNSGSIFVHLDWHAAHYVKVELDKIFGYDNFRNEIVWCYKSGGASKKNFSKKHDVILFYSKTKNFYYTPQKEKSYMGADYNTGNKNVKLYDDGDGKGKYTLVYPKDWWEIGMLATSSKERIGYPTQKPEELIEKIIKAACPEDGIVADFFSGGGTTAATAEKTGRKWLACDVSRIAISVARDRIQEVYSTQTGIAPINKKPKTGFVVQNHGAYEKALVRQLPEKDYLAFILQCYEATPRSIGEYIHGFKQEKAIHVGPSRGKISIDLIEEFHVELSDKKIESGIILAWSWDKRAESYIKELRDGQSGPEIQLIQVRLVDIDSHEFKSDNIRFLNKPAAVIRPKHKKGLNYVFDGTASQGRNNTDIHYYQWDFNYKGRFKPMTKPNFKKDTDGDGNPLNDSRKVEYEFPAEGKYKVALRIIDKSGAEDTHVIDFDTNQAKKKRAA